MKNLNTNSIFKISSNAEFEDLAYKIFEYQFQNNEIYNKYASLILKEKTPQKINQIPFLPISFFKTEEINFSFISGETFLLISNCRWGIGYIQKINLYSFS